MSERNDKFGKWWDEQDEDLRFACDAFRPAQAAFLAGYQAGMDAVVANMRAAFNATPEELGKNAVEAATARQEAIPVCEFCGQPGGH